MGHFTAKNFFFENPFQFLYELKQFHDEFERVFDDIEGKALKEFDFVFFGLRLFKFCILFRLQPPGYV